MLKILNVKPSAVKRLKSLSCVKSPEHLSIEKSVLAIVINESGATQSLMASMLIPADAGERMACREPQADISCSY